MTREPFEFETIGWAQFTLDDRARWRVFRAQRPDLSSPFFSLGWLDMVSQSCDDLRVIRVLEGGEPIAYFAHHCSPLGILRPAGGPLSDWHGVVGPSGLTIGAAALLTAVSASAITFSGTPSADPLLGGPSYCPTASHVVDLARGYDAYEHQGRLAQPKAFRNLRARQKKLVDRSVEIRLDDRDPEVLTRLLDLKSAQYRRTRQIDTFGVRWTNDLIERLFHAPRNKTRGLLSSLWIDGDLAAAHLGLLGDGTLHYWFPAYDANYAELSPGIVLLHHLASGARDLGFSRIDLGNGDDRFKEEFSNLKLPMVAGVAARPTVVGGVMAGVASVVERTATLPIGRLASLPERVSRRLERLISFQVGGAGEARKAS